MSEQQHSAIACVWFRRLVSSIMARTTSTPAASKLMDIGLFWNKLPRLLNLAFSRARSHTCGSVLDYEPLHLHVNPAETHPLLQSSVHSALPQQDPATRQFHEQSEKVSVTQPLRLTLNSFRFLLEQVPAVRTIEFSGTHRDPLENPELLAMVDYARKFNGAESTIYTNGLKLPSMAQAIVRSRLSTLAVRLYAHRPSQYARLTGKPPEQFVQMLNRIALLIQQKQACASKVGIALCLTVDIHNYREMPEMIRFAEHLGVDSLQLDNYLSKEGTHRTDRTLYTTQVPVVRFLQELRKTSLPASRLYITLPVPLEPDMSEHRHCMEPYSTVSVDAEFNVSACSRQLLPPADSEKIWDSDFFNNRMYTWLRGVYGHSASGMDSRPACRQAVPEPCRSCPRNMPVGRPISPSP